MFQSLKLEFKVLELIFQTLKREIPPRWENFSLRAYNIFLGALTKLVGGRFLLFTGFRLQSMSYFIHNSTGFTEINPKLFAGYY